MKIIVLGNAGSGKSTLANRLLKDHKAASLSLDAVAFSGGATRRPLPDSVEEAKAFIRQHDSWVIEGCYADIIEPLLVYADRLIFLNPGVEACVQHCLARPWEPDKFDSKQAQDANLNNLLDWVRSYEYRDDEYGLRLHRALFDGFDGDKVEYPSASDYGK